MAAPTLTRIVLASGLLMHLFLIKQAQADTLVLLWNRLHI